MVDHFNISDDCFSSCLAIWNDFQDITLVINSVMAVSL